jgi:hypothetical protein
MDKPQKCWTFCKCKPWINFGSYPGSPTIYGSHTPFPDSKVQPLYPNHQRYVNAVSEVTQKNFRDRFIVSEDAAEIIDAAEDSTIGTNVPRPVP